jgi:hypothetical protein
MDTAMKDELYPEFYRAFLLIARFNDKFLELASLLHELQGKQPDDFKTLISIPQLGRRKGYYLVEIHRAFGDYKNVTSRLNKIGWTKLQIIARHVTPDNREALLTLAESHSAKNLEAIMRGEEPIIGGRSVLLLFTQAQFAIFSNAILEHGAIANGQGFIQKETALISALNKIKK